MRLGVYFFARGERSQGNRNALTNRASGLWREDMQMSWTVILGILWQVIQQRSEAGWPWLIKFLERFWSRVESDVAEIRVGVSATVGAAPDELKTMLIELFTELRDKEGTGFFMRAVYSLLVKLVPTLLDKVWDKLFQAGHVTAAFSTFPAMVQAGGVTTADDLIEAANCCD